jgi:pyruvate dehydrogenase E2 component (dihydrolipoamide acetyltransferase)
MSNEKIQVPDLGGASDVDVIEILVAVGDVVDAETALVTLEGDKATMDVPSPKAGTVTSISISVGDKLNEGDVIVELDVGAPAVSEEATQAPVVATEQEVDIIIPDLGGDSDVDVIEVLAAVGDVLEKEAPLLTLEGDKATMDVPSAQAGKVLSITVNVGDKVSEGTVIGRMLASVDVKTAVQKAPVVSASAPIVSQPAAPMPVGDAYAGPAVRRLARELDIDLRRVKGSGNKGRISKDDIKAYLGGGSAGGNFPFKLAPIPKVDFSKFGATELKPLNKIKRSTAANMHRNWVGIPHVTQFENADITELEAYRQQHKGKALEQGVRLTPMAFIIKAMVAGLKEFPDFNASLDATGENLILKQYFNIGVAVETPNGLVVPVLKNVNEKSVLEIAKELGDISAKARDAGLGMKDMQGGSMTLSSLGGIGGTAFTPIINAPEVAILGVSKSSMRPEYDKASGAFKPRLMLPLSLSYDHRVIDGAQAARFAVYLSAQLADVATLLL